ncbi:MAG: ABC transporter ATP-binding protein [Bacteroidetes bacterium HGW-Bacteroidetes-19]|nr:MAG: ABC transporter ATP-binding protein [Bacteroidetes bacterium HGW-Bacteroidetes-20]PKP27447.1 MAG: ABC transporter ATP-binding protein [Bacteroidetes bacterium HGW-Bacteroidetes-19]
MVKIESIKFGYRKGRPLFDNLTLSLEKGSVYGLFGVNGAGKTTLIRQIAGLLFPEEGSVTVDGRISGRRDVEMMQKLFIIPEEFWLPSVTIEKYIEMQSVFYPTFNLETMKQILKEFEINENPKLDTMSYGQKKKFMIAFGIATNCSLILMDEPTNGLDIPSKSQFRKIMASFINEEHCVMISTHQVRDLSSIIDNVIVLDNGKIRFHESIETITNSFNFGIVSADHPSEIVYSEDIFGGKAAITKNSGKDTEIDFELLFNGVIKNGEIINNAIIRR